MTPSKQRIMDWSAMMTLQSAVTAPKQAAVKPVESGPMDVPADEFPWQECGPLGREDW